MDSSSAGGRAAHNRRVAAVWPVHLAVDRTLFHRRARRDAAVVKVELSTANATAVCQHLRKHWNHADGVWRVSDGDKKVRTFKGIASYGNLQTPLNAERQRCNTLLLGGGKELEFACTYVSGLAMLEREGLALASKLCAPAT
jgi:hypothetical protein